MKGIHGATSDRKLKLHFDSKNRTAACDIANINLLNIGIEVHPCPTKSLLLTNL